MKRALRRMIARVAPVVSPAGTRVLLYHSVEEPDADALIASAQEIIDLIEGG